MKRATILVLLLIAASTFGLAQEGRGEVTGHIVDRNDNPVPEVVVKLHHESFDDRTTTTDRKGYYAFFTVDPGLGYEVSASKDKYEITIKEKGAPSGKYVWQFDVGAGATQELLPDFIAVEGAPTVSKSTRRRLLNSSYRTQTVGMEVQSGAQLNRTAAGTPKLVAYIPGGSSSADGPAQNTSSSPSPAAQQSAPASAAPKQGSPTTTGAPGKQAANAQAARTESLRVPLETLSTAVGTVVTSTQLQNLPLFNRNFLAVGLLVSSTHDVPAWSELKDATFSISGQRPTSNAFLLDGTDNEASSSNQAIPFQVNDAIYEFRVTTANSDAQYGRNIGGVVNVVTRRGTRNFHGSAFGFFASDSIDASSPLSVYGGSGFDRASAFAGPLNAQPAPNTNPQRSPIYQPNSYNQYVKTVQQLDSTYNKSFCTAPNASFGSSDCLQLFDPAAVLAQNNSHTQPFSAQQFGARAGGLFAKRWYWFGDYEGTRIDNPNPIFERVPSSYDRSHLSEFPNNSDAAFAQAVLSLYPQSNVQAIPDVLEFYRGQAPNYTNVDNYMGRLDVTQSRTTEWTFRYNLQHLSQLHDDTLPSSSAYPGNGAQRAVLNQNLVGTLTHRFGNYLTNVLRGGFTRFQVEETPQDANFNPAQLGLPSGPMRTYLLSGLDPQYAGAKSGSNGAWGGWFDSIWRPPSNVPVITPSLDGLFPFARIGAPLGAPGKRQDSELELQDNVTWLNGPHTVRTGFDLRRLRNVFNNSGFSRGLVVSSNIGEFTSDSETCVTCQPAGFTSPSFNYAIKQPASFDMTFHSYVVAAYLEDTWRLKRNLTINLGIRYEYFSPPSETNHQLWNYDPSANGLVRQDETQVKDTFGSICGKNFSTMGSIYGLSRILPWACNPNGNGSFVVSNTTNFEPRIGVAKALLDGKLTVRAGFGIFYDQIPASLMAQLGFNRPTAKSNTNPQTLYGQNFFSTYCQNQQCGVGNASLVSASSQVPSAQFASVPFATSAIDPFNLNNPLTRQVNFSVQWQALRDVVTEVDYIANFMSNLTTTSNSGYNDEWFCTNSAKGHHNQPCDAFSFVPVFTTANIGYGNYNAFVGKITAKTRYGLQVRASYTYSKALDNASSAGAPLIPGPLMTQVSALNYFGTGSPLIYSLGTATTGFIPPPRVFSPSAITANLAALTGLLTAGVNTTGAGRVQVTPYLIPQDPYNFLTNDYGRADFDQTNRFILEYSWDVPANNGRAWRKGWMLSGVFVAESGQPFSIFSGPIAGELDQRVSLTGSLTSTGDPRNYIGNTSAIVLPGVSCASVGPSYSPYVIQTSVGIKSGVAGVPCIGDSGRNQFTGPAYVDYDMAVQKKFPLGKNEARWLSLRAESYNLFNRANYYNPISSYSLDGVTPYSQFGQIQSAHSPRQFQFSIRMNW